MNSRLIFVKGYCYYYGSLKNLSPCLKNRMGVYYYMRNIVINSVEKVFVLPVDEIIFIQALASYSAFNMSNGSRILSSQSLAVYEDLLKEEHFFRAHRSYLVNLAFITEIVKTGDVVLLNGTVLPIAKESIKQLSKALTEI